jgi:hypothetical protein
MAKDKSISFIVFIILLAFFTIQCSKLSPETKIYSQANANGNPKNSGYGSNGKVTGKILPFNFMGEDLKTSFVNQPLPEIWLTFSIENKSAMQNSSPEELKVDLPIEAKELLNLYWKDSLQYKFNTEIAPKPGVEQPSAEQYKEEMSKIVSAASRTKNELQKILITTPTEKRNISYEEAGELISFISSSAIELTNQVKQQKSN